MKQIPRKPFLLIGVLLVCLLPAWILVELMFAWMQPTRYGATATLVLEYPDDDLVLAMSMLRHRRRDLPDSRQLRARISPTWKVGRYSLTVTDVEPTMPGELANRWTGEIVEALNRPWPTGVPHARQVTQAESPASRLRPQVDLYTTDVLVPGLVSAVVGSVLLFTGLSLPKAGLDEPPPLPGEQSAKSDHEDLY